jgi:hypothetical protein
MTHKFAVGQSVVFTPGPGEIMSTETRGTVTRLLPKGDVEYQYQVEFGPDRQQRRVQESQLRPAALSKPHWPT